MSSSVQISTELEQVLREISESCGASGASEVFLGYPHSAAYEFFADGSRYTGKVSKDLVRDLTQALIKSGHQTIHDGGRLVQAGLCEFGNTQIVCVSWTGLSSKIDASDRCAAQAPEQAKEEDRLLLIDDDPEFSDLVRGLLSRNGYFTHCALTANQALQLLAMEHISLCICDLSFPLLDGRDLIRSIQVRYPHVPTLTLTSCRDPLVEAELVLLGTGAFVRKDSDPRILLAWIRNLLNRRVSSESS